MYNCISRDTQAVAVLLYIEGGAVIVKDSAAPWRNIVGLCRARGREPVSNCAGLLVGIVEQRWVKVIVDG